MIIQRVNLDGELDMFFLMLSIFPSLLLTMNFTACRIHDSLGVMTNNTIKQHTQMREELQNRHQDIANDVNRYVSLCAFVVLSFYIDNEV